LRVKLISHTIDPERTIAAAVRLCYSASDIDRIMEKIDDREAGRLIEKVLELGHFSTLEHASFTFAIEGISRACSHQLVRHRIASFSQQSQRYVKMRDPNFSIPNSIASRSEASAKFTEALEKIEDTYAELLEMGVNAEDARYILPNAAETKIIMTANARSLLNFFELRLCTRAQAEIRQLATLMREEVRAVAPNLFRLAGPTCESAGYCREGDKSCGRAPVLPRKAEGELE
jgi:thymidylate synthase (FAD)